MSILDHVNYEQEVAVEICNLYGEPMGFKWFVVSSSSKRVRSAAERAVAKTVVAGRGMRGRKADVAAVDATIAHMAKNKELIAKCVTRWDVTKELKDADAKTDNPDDFTFTPENVLHFLQTDWIFEQVAEVVGELENFIKK